MKRCPRCELWKSYLEFNKSKDRKDGYDVYCKPCIKQYRLDNLEKRRQYDRDRAEQRKLERSIMSEPNMEGTKICKRCKIEQPKTEFYSYKANKDGLHSYCKICERQRSAARRATLNSNPSMSYNISTEEYLTLVEKQENKCAICKELETQLGRGGKVKALSTDHDWDTGIIRGLLCTDCNTGLGKFNHSIELLQDAVNYLKRSKEKL